MQEQRIPRHDENKETNNTQNEIVPHIVTMPQPPKKRIYNPVTGTYYEVQQRTTDTRRRGQIKGSWSSKRK
jgi:hypothetical protein